MLFADTGFVVALLHRRDELHPRARAWVAAEISTILVSEPVCFEVMNQLSKPNDRHLAPAARRWIFENRLVRYVPSDHETNEAAWRMYSRHSDKEWSLTDCHSFVLMRQFGIREALAHDIHFEQAGFVALLPRNP